ncbi:MAG TPA: hypothetical protein VE262_14820 [Blastocatellia bacterium]|nr:hypothetical protein [Blastocatellia bacterium]
MFYNRINHKISRMAFAVAVLLTLVSAGAAQRARGSAARDGNVTILVTAHPHNERMRTAAQSLQPEDFSVREQKRPQRIISARRATDLPVRMAVLIQDDLVSEVNNELGGIRELIRALPQGSSVLIGYLTSGSLGVQQDFTTDLGRAADSLRIVRSSTSGTPYNPYTGVLDALRRFDSQPEGRRMIMFVSDGLDLSHGIHSASPSQSLALDRAISESQDRFVSAFTFYAPSIGPTSQSRLAINYGQGSLNRFADETGGAAFFSGTDFVTFDPYLKEFRETLGRQWLITYQSSNAGRGFRRIEVTSETGVHLHHQAGYKMK